MLACTRETSLSHGSASPLVALRPIVSRSASPRSRICCAPSPSRYSRNGRSRRSASMRSLSSAGRGAVQRVGQVHGTPTVGAPAERLNGRGHVVAQVVLVRTRSEVEHREVARLGARQVRLPRRRLAQVGAADRPRAGPTSTSATIRPPTGPRRRAVGRGGPATCASQQDVVPQRRRALQRARGHLGNDDRAERRAARRSAARRPSRARRPRRGQAERAAAPEVQRGERRRRSGGSVGTAARRCPCRSSWLWFDALPASAGAKKKRSQSISRPRAAGESRRGAACGRPGRRAREDRHARRSSASERK